MFKLSKIAKLSLALSVAAPLVTSPIIAQEATEQSSVGIEVSSPLYEFTIKPGNNAQDIIKIRNVSSAATTFYPEVLDFVAKDESGTPSFLKPGEDSGTYSLAKWITFTKEAVTLAPNKSEAFNFVVNVPADAEPGGHYAGILFSTQAPKSSGTGINVATKVGSLVLVRVAGDAQELASLKEFSTDKQSYNQADVRFTTRIENSGNVHVQPKGTITIRNLFGGQVAVLDVNSLSANVLPGSIRKFETNWDSPGFKLGLYRATLSLNYGDPAKTLSSQVSFWILPWTQIVIGLVVLILLLVILYLAVKRYNSWIVSRAQRSEQ